MLEKPHKEYKHSVELSRAEASADNSLEWEEA